MITNSDMISIHKELTRIQKTINSYEQIIAIWRRTLECHSNNDDNSLLKYNCDEK